MKAIVTMSDRIKLEVEEKTPMETLHIAIILANPRNYCNVCGSKEGFYFTTNKDKEGNTYVNCKCSKCESRSKLGQYKTGGFFWREFEKYERPTVSATGGNENESAVKTVKTGESADEQLRKPVEDEDIPF
jgi:hypothetical protein